MELARLLKQRDIIFIVCAGTITTQVVALAELLTTSFIVPIINGYRNTSETFENASMTVRGVKVEHGKFVVALIRVILMILLLVMLYKCLYTFV